MLQPGFFDIEKRLSDLSGCGDPLEAINRHVDFESFRTLLKEKLAFTGNKIKGGRPPIDPIVMFKVLILQSLYNLSDDQAEFQIKDRLSFMRFLDLSLCEKVPDAKTIWLYRERLKGHMNELFRAFETQLKERGYLAMGGQIVDASVIKAPRQRMKEDEKAAIKEGKSAGEIWDNPAKARQKDRDARWRVKQSRAKKKGQVPLAIPEFGYKNNITVDRRYGFIRNFRVTDAARFDGSELKSVLSKENTSSKVWGDTAYFTQENQAFLKDNGFTSCLHRKKPRGKLLPAFISRGNSKRSSIRARVEHVFALQKYRMGLFVRTIGIARAHIKIGFSNLAYNMRRLVFHELRKVTG